MLPSYVSASYLGAAPLYMNVYQHINNLRSYPHSLAAHHPHSTPFFPAGLLPQPAMSSQISGSAGLAPKQINVQPSDVKNTAGEGHNVNSLLPALSQSPKDSEKVQDEEASGQNSPSGPAQEASPVMKFSIDAILGLKKNSTASSPTQGDREHKSQSSGRKDDGDEEEEEDDESLGRKDVTMPTADVEGVSKMPEDPTNSYPWLQCTRYHPPKLQRSKKKDGGGKKRKLGRNPRVPFTQHQVAVLEEKFRRTHYLSSMDVAELSSALTLSETRESRINRRAGHGKVPETPVGLAESMAHRSLRLLKGPERWYSQTCERRPPKGLAESGRLIQVVALYRVKIWFQNRRARERREREASQRAQLLTQKPYQPLSIPSVTWALTSHLAPSAFSTQYRNDMNFRPGLFSSAFSAFSVPVRTADAVGAAAAAAAAAAASTPTTAAKPATCSWTDSHNNSDEDSIY